MMSLNRTEFVKALTKLENTTPDTVDGNIDYVINLKKLEDEQFESLDEDLDHKWIDNDPTAWMAEDY